MPQQAAGRRARGQSEASGHPPGLKRKDAQEVGIPTGNPKSIIDVYNEVEFAEWYNEVEDGLLETSYDEYQYARASKTIFNEGPLQSSIAPILTFLLCPDHASMSFRRQNPTLMRSCLIPLPPSTS